MTEGLDEEKSRFAPTVGRESGQNPLDRFRPAAKEAKPESSTKAKAGTLGVGIAFLLAKLKSFGAALVSVAKFAKLGKVFASSSTMLLSMWVYAQQFGWAFAIGFVLSILVHEMGHVVAARRKGIPVSAPLFIPGVGALILRKGRALSVWDDAVIGFAGPLAGGIAAAACGVAGLVMDSLLLRALAYTGFFINLFNLIPIFPLDGGWIVAAISPRIWILGIVGLAALYFAGIIHNPFILILCLLSLPHLIGGIRHGTLEGVLPTRGQRWTMAILYLSLAAALSWGMTALQLPHQS